MRSVFFFALAVVCVSATPSPCESYCGVMVNYTNASSSLDGQYYNASACPEVYPQLAPSAPPYTTCLFLCSLWQVGNVTDLNGDTIGCRTHYANSAKNFAGRNESEMLGGNGYGNFPNTTTWGDARLTLCAYAGPTGGAPEVGYMCGTLQDFYCDVITAGNSESLFQLASLYKCTGSGYLNKAACMADVKLNILPANPPVTITLSTPVLTGDSLECRLSYAAFGLNVTDSTPAATVCPPAYWHGVGPSSSASCGIDYCTSFCNAYGTTCGFGSTGLAGSAQYADAATCKADCALFPYNQFTSFLNGTWPLINTTYTAPFQTFNSVGCRRYHLSIAATNDANSTGRQQHCSHAGNVSQICVDAPYVPPKGGVGSTISPVLALVVALVALATRF